MVLFAAITLGAALWQFVSAADKAWQQNWEYDQMVCAKPHLDWIRAQKAHRDTDPLRASDIGCTGPQQLIFPFSVDTVLMQSRDDRKFNIYAEAGIWFAVFAVGGLLAWGALWIIGWVVSGFFRDEPDYG